MMRAMQAMDTAAVQQVLRKHAEEQARLDCGSDEDYYYSDLASP